MKKNWLFNSDSPRIRKPRVDSRAQQIAVNVFADMGATPQTPDSGIVVVESIEVKNLRMND